jgi:hypothetical protein
MTTHVVLEVLELSLLSLELLGCLRAVLLSRLDRVARRVLLGHGSVVLCPSASASMKTFPNSQNR